jgi:hypothetical protein
MVPCQVIATLLAVVHVACAAPGDTLFSADFRQATPLWTMTPAAVVAPATADGMSIRGVDSSLQSWYFDAPGPFLGERSALYNATLEWTIEKIEWSGSFVDDYDVLLSCRFSIKAEDVISVRNVGANPLGSFAAPIPIYALGARAIRTDADPPSKPLSIRLAEDAGWRFISPRLGSLGAVREVPTMNDFNICLQVTRASLL